MMITLIFIVCISIAYSYREIMKYNVKYCISIPHYLSISGPRHNKNNIKIDTSYEIPKYMFEEIFTQNIPYKKKNKQ